MRERIINYLILQVMADPEFNAPLMQRVRVALIIAKKKYKNMCADELDYIWQKIRQREGGCDDSDLEQGN
jgi:hypothetical protein